MIRAVVRTDASVEMGFGHLSRCLALAAALSRRGVDVAFVTADASGDPLGRVRSAGYRAIRLPPEVAREVPAFREVLAPEGPFDWLVVDHYGLDAEWEVDAGGVAAWVLAIDDLGGRAHDCQVLLDPTYGEDGSRHTATSPRAERLLGTAFVLIAEGFARARQAGIERSREEAVHVMFGGSDPGRHTWRFASAIAERFPALRQEVALGAGSDPAVLDTTTISKPRGIRVERDVRDMAAHMRRCTVAVGAPGVATWERACMGLPTFHVATSEGQSRFLRTLAERGFSEHWVDADRVSDGAFVSRFAAFLEDRDALDRARALGLRSVDGLGADRVADAMIAYRA